MVYFRLQKKNKQVQSMCSTGSFATFLGKRKDGAGGGHWCDGAAVS